MKASLRGGGGCPDRHPDNPELNRGEEPFEPQ